MTIARSLLVCVLFTLATAGLAGVLFVVRPSQFQVLTIPLLAAPVPFTIYTLARRRNVVHLVANSSLIGAASVGICYLIAVAASVVTLLLVEDLYVRHLVALRWMPILALLPSIASAGWSAMISQYIFNRLAPANP